MLTRYRRLLPALAGLMLLFTGALAAQQGGQIPGNSAGTDFDIVITPGASPGSLNFTYSNCQADCDERPVKASSRSRRSTVTFKFRFANERVIHAQVGFTGGTPLFQESPRKARGRKFYDAYNASARGQGLGFAEIRKPIKTLNWRRPEGLGEIEDGDAFKYDVMVITEAAGQTKVYSADPIIIVRGAEDEDTP